MALLRNVKHQEAFPQHHPPQNIYLRHYFIQQRLVSHFVTKPHLIGKIFTKYLARERDFYRGLAKYVLARFKIYSNTLSHVLPVHIHTPNKNRIYGKGVRSKIRTAHVNLVGFFYSTIRAKLCTYSGAGGASRDDVLRSSGFVV